MGNGSLPTCSKNTITDNTGLLKTILSKPVETEKVHPNTANGACVKTDVGHKPDRKP